MQGVSFIEHKAALPYMRGFPTHHEEHMKNTLVTALFAPGMSSVELRYGQ